MTQEEPAPLIKLLYSKSAAVFCFYYFSWASKLLIRNWWNIKLKQSSKTDVYCHVFFKIKILISNDVLLFFSIKPMKENDTWSHLHLYFAMRLTWCCFGIHIFNVRSSWMCVVWLFFPPWQLWHKWMNWSCDVPEREGTAGRCSVTLSAICTCF